MEASSHRAHLRKLRTREKYASKVSAFEERHKKFAEVHNDLSDVEALHTEIARLRKQAQREADANELAELGYSACALVVFWLLGALIYHFMEGWSYGDSLYFNYVFFLTIGFGDFSPATDVGKVVFVIWALLAVPVMTNFVVSSVQSMVTHASRLLAMGTTQKKLEVEAITDEYFQPHSSYLDEAIKKLKGSGDSDDDSSRESDIEAQEDNGVDDTEQVSVQKQLLLDVLSTSCFLEAQARRIMLENMDKKSHARVLLEADANIQLYTLDRMGKTEQVRWLEEYEKSMGDGEELKRVKKYRQTYARMLVMGGKLMNLEGDELLAFQRKRSREDKVKEAESNANASGSGKFSS